jgi:6-phosphogluconate dehydrogenase
MNRQDIGVIGLGVMGRSLAVNLMNHGFTVAGYNRRREPAQALAREYPEKCIACATYQELVSQLNAPRVILMMVPAGAAVDDVIRELVPLLEKGDALIDGGNSFYEDTARRQQELAARGIDFFGTGVSGGEEGALKGPSIMPGGPREGYAKIQRFLETIAASKGGMPCCTYIGPEGAGHYVKMVHNGIEYADMQLLSECYLILAEGGRSNAAIADLFEKWNRTEVESFLVKISADILREKDDQSENDLIDMIRDAAGNKGTGRWTSIEALKQEYNASLLTAAYQARVMSNQTELRRKFHGVLPVCTDEGGLDAETIRRAYSLAKVIAYAQGFGLYHDASERNGWHLDLKAIASIFRAGCIIQARLLQDIMNAYEAEPELANLLEAKQFSTLLQENIGDLKKTVLWALAHNVPLPLFTNALIYVSQLSADSLGANMIQAQRDYFGAHTFERIDGEGHVHHEWGK